MKYYTERPGIGEEKMTTDEIQNEIKYLNMELDKQMENDLCVESNSIKDILSTLITDMAVNGATFDELALVTKMSKDIIDILDDYDYREFKRKYQENRTMETMEDKTLYLIVRPTFPKWEDGILDEYISLVGIFDSEKASNQICDENDKVFEVKLNHIYPVDITGGNFNPEEILIGGAWRDKG